MHLRHLAGVFDHCYLPARNDAAGTLVGVVDVVNFEGHRAVSTMAGKKTVRCRADDDGLVHHRVVHRHQVRTVGDVPMTMYLSVTHGLELPVAAAGAGKRTDRLENYAWTAEVEGR